MRQAFTMIELIFVIVILGILASVAVPKLSAVRDDAKIVSVKSDLATIINEITTTITVGSEIKSPDQLSPTLKSLVLDNRAGITASSPITNSKGQVTFYTKYGDANDNTFVLDINSTTLSIKHGTPCNGTVCKKLQELLDEKDYFVVGQRIKM